MTILRTRSLLLLALCALSFCTWSAGTGAAPDELDRILSSSEMFFKAMDSRDYVRTWAMLSSKSRVRIINDISKAVGPGYPEKQIEKDLAAGGQIALSYWKGFLENFDPGIVLEQSKWEVGYIESEKAELLITYRKSKQPARLRMFKEGGAWKVGLVETFWTRK